MKEFITNGGNLISRDGFGRMRINGKDASGTQVKQQIKADGGQLHQLRGADRKTQKFGEMQRSAMRQQGRRV
jgi:hypothetical protein